MEDFPLSPIKHSSDVSTDLKVTIIFDIRRLETHIHYGWEQLGQTEATYLLGPRHVANSSDPSVSAAKTHAVAANQPWKLGDCYQ